MTFITFVSRRRKDAEKEKRKNEQEKRGGKSENVAIQTTEKREREKIRRHGENRREGWKNKVWNGHERMFF